VRTVGVVISVKELQEACCTNKWSELLSLWEMIHKLKHVIPREPSSILTERDGKSGSFFNRLGKLPWNAYLFRDIT
jgi:hypothetical protein